LAGTTYYATVAVDGPTGTPKIDCRPSDALNLATLTQAPVTVGPAVLDALAQMRSGTPSAHHLLRDASAHAADIATQTVERLRAELEQLHRRETDTCSRTRTPSSRATGFSNCATASAAERSRSRPACNRESASPSRHEGGSLDWVTATAPGQVTGSAYLLPRIDLASNY
jgi:hypothetical protein